MSAWSRPARDFSNKYGEPSNQPAVDTHHSCVFSRVIIAGRNACSRRASAWANASSMNDRSKVPPWPALSVFASMLNRDPLANLMCSLPLPQ